MADLTKPTKPSYIANGYRYTLVGSLVVYGKIEDERKTFSEIVAEFPEQVMELKQHAKPEGMLVLHHYRALDVPTYIRADAVIAVTPQWSSGDPLPK